MDVGGCCLRGSEQACPAPHGQALWPPWLDARGGCFCNSEVGTPRRQRGAEAGAGSQSVGLRAVWMGPETGRGDLGAEVGPRLQPDGEMPVRPTGCRYAESTL